MADIEEEIEVVQSVYCFPGECVITDVDGDKQVDVKISSQSNDQREIITVSLSFTSNYPVVPPEISVTSSHYNRSTLSTLRHDAVDFATSLCGQAMILPILSFVQEKFGELSCDIPGETKSNLTPDSDTWTALMHLDHMRAKNKYLKTIEKWSTELCLVGRLVFFGKLILILLQGQKSNIKEYVVRQRTVNVDVDSHGRSCKERMLTVLCEEKCKSNKRYKNFQVVECASEKDLKSLFVKCDLGDIYDVHIKPLKGTYF